MKLILGPLMSAYNAARLNETNSFDVSIWRPKVETLF